MRSRKAASCFGRLFQVEGTTKGNLARSKMLTMKVAQVISSSQAVSRMGVSGLDPRVLALTLLASAGSNQKRGTGTAGARKRDFLIPKRRL